MKEITIVRNSINISAVLFYPPILKSKYNAILFVNGWGSDKKSYYQYAESLSKLGFLCFLFDLRGQGESKENGLLLSNRDFLDNTLIAYDYLYTLSEVDKENISAIGTSFGGYLVTLLSSKRKLKNIVLRVPAIYPDDLFDTPVELSSGSNPKVREFRTRSQTYKDSIALEAIHNFSGDLLIIESEMDDKIPRQTIMNYLNAVSDKNKLIYVIMKGALHISKEKQFMNEVERIKTDWFKTRISIR
jgi:esterase/lipase